MLVESDLSSSKVRENPFETLRLPEGGSVLGAQFQLGLSRLNT